MKRILFALAMVLAFSLTAQGKYRTVTENDSLGKLKRIIELHDTILDEQMVTDTLSITIYDNNQTNNDQCEEDMDAENKDDFFPIPAKTFFSRALLVPLLSIAFFFTMPVLLIFIIFYFRYKNRKAKYHLAEQALAAGQPLPESFFKERTYDNTRNKGIKNICLGIGLFIFLWAITENFGIGCIGLLILCTGIGQMIIYRSQEKSHPSSPDRNHADAQ